MEKITKEGYNKIIEGRKEEQKLDKRMEYIVKCIVCAFEGNGFSFQYPNSYYDEDDGHYYQGHFNYYDNSDIIKITINTSVKHKYGVDLKCYIGDKLLNLKNGFPFNWLFDDFEEELKIGIKKYKREDNVYKSESREAQKKRRTEQRTIAEKAKKKLTPEELKALKASLYWKKGT